MFELFERGLEFIFDDIPAISEKIVEKTIDNIDKTVDKILDM